MVLPVSLCSNFYDIISGGTTNSKCHLVIFTLEMSPKYDIPLDR